VGLSGVFGAGEGGEGEGVEGCPLSAEGGGRGEVDGHGGAVMEIMKDSGCLDSVLCTENDTKSSRNPLMHPHTILYVLK